MSAAMCIPPLPTAAGICLGEESVLSLAVEIWKICQVFCVSEALALRHIDKKPSPKFASHFAFSARLLNVSNFAWNFY
jgi:hypothetical protein